MEFEESTNCHASEPASKPQNSELCEETETNSVSMSVEAANVPKHSEVCEMTDSVSMSVDPLETASKPKNSEVCDKTETASVLLFVDALKEASSKLKDFEVCEETKRMSMLVSASAAVSKPKNSEACEETETDRASIPVNGSEEAASELQNSEVCEETDRVAMPVDASEAAIKHQNSEVHEQTETDGMLMCVDDNCEASSLHDTMLNHLATSKIAHFKSQQVGEPELSFEQKRTIAENILIRNPGQFLSRFGRFLLSQHLEYFTELDKQPENYEVTFHLKQLQRYHCKEKNKVDVKNRRFEALKKLVKEGAYFSEKEMKLRNPLLYQQLVGQYLSKDEVEDRRNADRADVTSWVTLLLAQIERDQMLCLRKQQKDYEDGAIEEMDTSDEEEGEEEDDEEEDDEDDEEEEEDDDEEEEEEEEDEVEKKMDVVSDGCHKNKIGNGQVLQSEDKEKNNRHSFTKSHKKRKLLNRKEKNLLREEFISNMYRSFLEGKDQDFDYSEVDLNPEYECLAVRSQDEEEKYFDSETPELVADEKCSDEEEDELDAYMKNLKPEPTPSELAGNFNILL